MKSPIDKAYGWYEIDEVDSTQNVAAKILTSDEPYGVVLAHNQTQGKGRMGRTWISQRGDSLTMSLIFRGYGDHPRPYLVGMAAAAAAAGALHCQLRWPNDLVVGTRKVGGILSEIMKDKDGRGIPVVGIGINLNQTAFPPEIEDIASSLHLAHGGTYVAEAIAASIIKRIDLLPEPTDWPTLAPVWDLFDRTPGKMYRLTSGDYAVALGVGSDGQLLCSVDGESQSVMAAEAIFGLLPSD